MKKLFGIILSLQIALLLFFVTSSPAHADWERGMYRQHVYGNNRHDGNMMYNHWNFHHAPLLGLLGHRNSPSFAYASIYKLAVDIILSILFIIFFSKFILSIFTHMKEKPFKSGYVGFTFLVVFPLIAIILLGLLWLGVIAFLSYGLIFLVGLFLAKIFIGWAILRKLEKGYILDWKAGLIGPLVVFILLFIPILGWITLAVIMSVATGGLLQEILPLFEKHRLVHKTTKK